MKYPVKMPELCEAAIGYSRSKGFRDVDCGVVGFAFRVAMILTELAEADDEWLNASRAGFFVKVDWKLEEELADVLIRMAELAAGDSIPMGEEVEAMLAVTYDRPWSVMTVEDLCLASMAHLFQAKQEIGSFEHQSWKVTKVLLASVEADRCGDMEKRNRCLAEGCIRVAAMAKAFGRCSLEVAVTNKMHANLSRPPRHGKLY